MKFKFHATQSEQRILADLLSVCARRKLAPPSSLEFTSAEAYTRALEQLLFPETWALRQKRSVLLTPLKAPYMKANFDNDLESGRLSLQVSIATAAEYSDLVARLTAFSFSDWLTHCNNERSHAD